MAMSVPELRGRIASFKGDLERLDLLQVIRRHITTGPSVVLNDTQYYDLRSEVAAHFNIHPSSVVMVGSCRTGFSIKPTKRYAYCQETSDVDMAIVSRERFDMYWDLVFDHWRTDLLWTRSRRYRGFLRDLFNGWIWPRRLPPSPHFKEAMEWVQFEDRLGRERFRGIRSVGARLYRSWDRLEAYQAIHVAQCKTALTGEKR